MRHTTNYNFALPDGADNVDVSILNGNMVEVERILNDIYSKLPTPPPQPIRYVIEINSETGTKGNDIAGTGTYYVYGEMDESINLQEGDLWKVRTEVTGEGPVEYAVFVSSDLSFADIDFTGLHIQYSVQDATQNMILDKCQWDLSGEHDSATVGETTGWRFGCWSNGQIIPTTVTLEKLTFTPAEILANELTHIEGFGEVGQLNKSLNFYETIFGVESTYYSDGDDGRAFEARISTEDVPEGVEVIEIGNAFVTKGYIYNHCVIDFEHESMEYSENNCTVAMVAEGETFDKLVIENGYWVES